MQNAQRMSENIRFSRRKYIWITRKPELILRQVINQLN